jgi:hypothetical protein
MSSSCKTLQTSYGTMVGSPLKPKHEWILGSDWNLVVCVRSCRLHPEVSGSITNVDAPAVIYQQPRPGPKLPKGESYVTIGWKQVRNYLLISVESNSKQIWVALKQYKELPYTFTFLFSFFLLADVRGSHSEYDCVMLTLSNDCSGPKHYRHTGIYLPE